jgi:hypothetical protein
MHHPSRCDSTYIYKGIEVMWVLLGQYLKTAASAGPQPWHCDTAADGSQYAFMRSRHLGCASGFISTKLAFGGSSRPAARGGRCQIRGFP